MLLLFNTQPTNDFTALKHAIQHDIEEFADLDEFLADDPEDCLHAMLGNAGCFY